VGGGSDLSDSSDRTRCNSWQGHRSEAQVHALKSVAYRCYRPEGDRASGAAARSKDYQEDHGDAIFRNPRHGNTALHTRARAVIVTGGRSPLRDQAASHRHQRAEPRGVDRLVSKDAWPRDRPAGEPERERRDRAASAKRLLHRVVPGGKRTAAAGVPPESDSPSRWPMRVVQLRC
jgi:hypothetical protein